jgi:SAM domain (Sterile alpha motif)
MDIGAWLSNLGLQQYELAFRNNDIDAEVLPKLTTEDLIGIGIISIGHRRKLLEAAAMLPGPGFAPATRKEPETDAQLKEPEGERRQVAVLFVDLAGYGPGSGRTPCSAPALLR